jgi:hypothetical protein
MFQLNQRRAELFDGQRDRSSWTQVQSVSTSDECPLWVKSRHTRRNKSCPLYPRQRPRKRISANGHVRFTPKADMCGAIAHVCFGPRADSCTAPNSPIRSPRELWQSTRIGFRRSILSWGTSRDPVSARSLGRSSSSPLGQSAKQVRSGVSSRPATSQLRSMSFGSHPCRALVHRVYD